MKVVELEAIARYIPLWYYCTDIAYSIFALSMTKVQYVVYIDSKLFSYLILRLLGIWNNRQAVIITMPHSSFTHLPKYDIMPGAYLPR